MRNFFKTFNVEIKITIIAVAITILITKISCIFEEPRDSSSYFHHQSYRHHHHCHVSVLLRRRRWPYPSHSTTFCRDNVKESGFCLYFFVLRKTNTEKKICIEERKTERLSGFCVQRTTVQAC